MMKNISLGLPVVVLQFARVRTCQGRNIVQSVDGVSKLYINPHFYEAKKFKKGLVLALNRKRKTLGFSLADKAVGFNFNTKFQCKTILQLREDPNLGIYVINARLTDITALYSWWYPVCRCDIIIESYLGAFLCEKCHATDFEPLLKYRVKIIVEDESGSTFLEAFDHVMLPIAVIDPKKPGISKNYFPRAFDSVVGKSIMFIVEKKKHSMQHLDAMFELICVSDNPEVVKFYVDKGLCNTPSKAISKIIDEECNLMKPIPYSSPVTTTRNLLDEYWNPDARRSPLLEVGESSNVGDETSNDRDCNSRSVRPRLTL